MSTEEEQYEDGAMGAPGAPTPVSALEVRVALWSKALGANKMQGVNGLTARDIKLVIDGGYNTVEAIAYTYVGQQILSDPTVDPKTDPEEISSR